MKRLLRDRSTSVRGLFLAFVAAAALCLTVAPGAQQKAGAQGGQAVRPTDLVELIYRVSLGVGPCFSGR